MTYKDSGVDIQAGDELVARISPAAKATARRGASAALGGFGGLFDLKEAGFKDPLLVAATDGRIFFNRNIMSNKAVTFAETEMQQFSKEFFANSVLYQKARKNHCFPMLYPSCPTAKKPAAKKIELGPSITSYLYDFSPTT